MFAEEKAEAGKGAGRIQGPDGMLITESSKKAELDLGALSP